MVLRILLYATVPVLVLVACKAEEQSLPVLPPIEARVPSLEELRTQAVIEQALRWGADPDLMLKISRQENTGAVPDAWSKTRCCVGIMQVNVLQWAGFFDRECGSDLLDMRTNACYGVLIYLYHLNVDCDGDVYCALRSYYMGPKLGREPSAKGNRYVQAVLSQAGL